MADRSFASDISGLVLQVESVITNTRHTDEADHYLAAEC